MTLTFKVDPDGIQVHLHTKFHGPSLNTDGDMNFGQVNFGQVNFGQVNFGQVTDRRKAMHKSPLCISTGGLKKLEYKVTFLAQLTRSSTLAKA